MPVVAPPFRTRDTEDFKRRLAIAWDAAGRPRVPYTSYWRSAYDNARVGGHPNSQHLTGLAADVAIRGASEDVEAFIAAAGAAGLTVIDEGDHWHIQRYQASPGRGLCCSTPKSATSFLDAAFGYVTKPRFSLLDLIPF